METGRRGTTTMPSAVKAVKVCDEKSRVRLCHNDTKSEMCLYKYKLSLSMLLILFFFLQFFFIHDL